MKVVYELNVCERLDAAISEASMHKKTIHHFVLDKDELINLHQSLYPGTTIIAVKYGNRGFSHDMSTHLREHVWSGVYKMEYRGFPIKTTNPNGRGEREIE